MNQHDPGAMDHVVPTNDAVLSVDSVSVTYATGTTALHQTSLNFQDHAFTVLLGPSGAGKSTLLRSLNLLVRPTTGVISARDMGPLDSAATIRDHRKRCAMIFQQHQLIGRLSALSNVLTGRLGRHSSWRTLLPASDEERRLALSCLDRVGLLEKALSRCDAMSGGQQQRVGIARALWPRNPRSSWRMNLWPPWTPHRPNAC